MSRMEWAHRVLGRTRGEILGLLCRGPRTVSEVSKALELTPNGVRSHLAGLEADGLVRLIGARRQLGKPAHVYELSPAGRTLLSTAYRPALEGVLDAVREHDSSAVERIVRSAGKRLAARFPKATGDLKSRAEKGAALMRELGAVTEVEADGKAWIIRGVCCPLGAVVPDHPETCKLMEALLGEVTGETIKEFCHKAEPAMCQFRIPAGGGPERKRSTAAR
jgi:predicted ArsR family transcriptional regulator